MLRLNIRKIRKSKGLTQEELGFKIGVTQQTISQLENGEHQNIFDLLEDLANALNVCPLSFFECFHCIDDGIDCKLNGNKEKEKKID
jgi:transcriptional regulator with XRE-family HTH domain